MTLEELKENVAAIKATTDKVEDFMQREMDAIWRKNDDLEKRIRTLEVSVGKLVVIVAVIAAAVGGATGSAVQWILKGF